MSAPVRQIAQRAAHGKVCRSFWSQCGRCFSCLRKRLVQKVHNRPFGTDCVRSMSLTAFAERYRKWCKRHGYNFSQSKAVEVHTGAQDLIAMLPKDALTKTMVRQAIDALERRLCLSGTAQG